MKKFTYALFTMAVALVIVPTALAGTLCPNQAAQGGFRRPNLHPGGWVAGRNLRRQQRHRHVHTQRRGLRQVEVGPRRHGVIPPI